MAGNQALPKPAVKITRGNPLYHKWFAGYFPVEKPKYALVVVHLDEASGRAKTNDAFYDIVKRSTKLKRNRHRTSLHVMLE
ncbi:penicillin-binding transpeptidase domain-containing protein [Bacillus sp. SL00103]